MLVLSVIGIKWYAEKTSHFTLANEDLKSVNFIDNELKKHQFLTEIERAANRINIAIHAW